MKIGFFGDSFCEYIRTPHSIARNYTTYLKMLANHYNAEIVHKGQGGSSVADVCLLQVPPMLDQLPDICVFVWTDRGRLYNQQVRKINSATATQQMHLLNRNIWNSAKKYYENLYDDEYHRLMYDSMLLHFDTNILPKFAGKKIVHLWAFGDPDSWDDKGFKPQNLKYNYRWKHGVEIRPALTSLCINDQPYEIWNRSHPANHINGKIKNTKVFNWICDAIDNYQDGRLLEVNNL